MKLYIIGDIDYTAYREFTEQMDNLERRFAKTKYIAKAITIELSSDGGDAEVGLAFYDRIKRSPLEVTILGTGSVYSAASLILAAGDKRILTKNARVLIHEESLKLTGNVSNIERDIKHFRDIESQYSILMASSCLGTPDRWDKLAKEETYLTPAECLDLGLAHEVLND